MNFAFLLKTYIYFAPKKQIYTPTLQQFRTDISNIKSNIYHVFTNF